MNTQDMSDNNLDAMFREASDLADYKYNEQAWLKLEKRINFSLFIRRVIRSLYMGGAILILTIPTYLYFHSNQGIQPVHQALLLDQQKPLIGAVPQGRNIINPAGSNSDSNIGNKHSSVMNSGTNASTEKVVHFVPDQAPVSKPNIIPEGMESGQRSAEMDTSFLNQRGISFTDISGIRFPEQRKKVLIPSAKTYRFHPGLDLNIILGPELSGVNVNETGFGLIEGLGLDYRFTRHLNIGLGALHVKKNYSVISGEYQIPDPSFNYYGKSPKNISISCHVLDIPLNLNYSIWQNDRNEFYAGTGLSSYLMLTEEYSYSYGAPGNIKFRKLIIRNENQHYFEILNFTAGYARTLNRHWAWDIESYYKLPMAGIAAAKVRLKSLGLLVSFRYRIK